MNIRVLQLTEGAKEATGVTVVIDVFRAFSVEAYFMALGASKVIPVGSLEMAYEFKEKNPEIILAGERHGKILPGFDVGNSPSELVKLDVKDRIVVHTTSAGTQGIANAQKATEILGASLVNAKATAKYIEQIKPGDVSLVCMGLEALEPTDEDTLCAEYIKSILEGNEEEITEKIKALRYTSGAKFFDKNQNDVFPEKDFHMCTELNKFDFVLKLNKSSGEYGYMEKINV